jgi:hypothetical protein
MNRPALPLLAALAVFAWGDAAIAADGPSHVTLETTAAGTTPGAAPGWLLKVDGAVFPIHGAGGASAPGLLEKLAAAGGNTVRTWGIQEMEAKVTDGKRFIDRAQELGLKVIPGIWVGHERHGMNYADAAMVQKQRDEVLASVRKYKDHPAVLLWGLGNEMEGYSQEGSVPALQEVEELAKLVKKEDPNHPVMTVISFSPAKIPNVLKYCPDIDVLGINAYGGAVAAGEALRQAGWTKPFVITEFGVSGHWEVAQTTWGAPLEETSSEKARSFYASQHLVTVENPGHEQCLGTCVFLWGWKQECTPTWYGMFLQSGEKLPMVDVMTYAWTGAWPANRCPKIVSIDSLAGAKPTRPDQTISATVKATDPENDPLTYRWDLLAESTANVVGGDHEAASASFSAQITSGAGPECVLKTPGKPGNYRLFVYVYDGKGGAATANLPISVGP